MENGRPGRLIWLDSVRGLAILIVLTVHIIQAVPKYHDAVSGCGKMGVWLLFLLTGFFTFRSYLAAGRKKENKDIAGADRKNSSLIKQFAVTSLRFYLKRIIRIYPAFSAVLAVSVFIGYLDWPEAVKNFLLLEGTGHFWTLPVELKFYLLIPVFGLVFTVLKRNEYRMIFLAGTAILFSVLFFYGNCPENSIELGWYLPVLLSGGLLNYLICKDHESISEEKTAFDTYRTGHLGYDAAAVICILAFFFMIPGIRYIIFGIPVSRYLADKYLYLSLLWIIFLFSVDRSLYIRCLLEKSRILPFFGKISYSLYLVHYIVIQHLGSVMENQKAKSIVALVISLMAALFLESMIERPVIRLSKNFLN